MTTRAFRIGGHRGFGCTDSEHAQKMRDVSLLPPENTLPSIAEAFKWGADFIECDVVMTRDHRLVVTHSSNLADHVFTGDLPARFVDELTLEEIGALHVGADATGVIPTLEEVLDLVEAAAPATGFALNLEIKDSKGTNRVAPEPIFYEILASTVAHGPLPLTRIVFSSFATRNLVALNKLLPQAALAQLFIEKGGEERGAYADALTWADNYLAFNPENLARVLDTVPILYAHPEIQTLDAINVDVVAEAGLGLTTWGWLEEPPKAAPKVYEDFIARVQDYPHDVALITDYIGDVKARLRS